MMAAVFIDELVKSVMGKLLLQYLGISRARVTAQSGETCTVRCAWGEISNVAICTLPQTQTLGIVGSDVLLAWPMSTDGRVQVGPGELPVIIAFMKNANFSKIKIGGSSTQPVARKMDTVDCGTLRIVAVASGVFTGTYTPPGGVPVPVTIGQNINLSGKIETGSDRVEVG